jgi:hypothetical protein
MKETRFRFINPTPLLAKPARCAMKSLFSGRHVGMMNQRMQNRCIRRARDYAQPKQWAGTARPWRKADSCLTKSA